MKDVLVSDLKGGEILGVPIVSSTDVVLVHSDVVLDAVLIERIKELGVVSVLIRDDSFSDKKHFTIEETQEQSKEIVRKVFERHIYKQTGELAAIGEQAEKIVTSVIENPQVLEEVTEIRKISTDMYSHCINVCSLATIMALRLKMSEHQVRNVSLGAILHDIGLRYVTVPYMDVDIEHAGGNDALEYKKHTIYGYSAAQAESWIPDTVKEIILLHHERENGSGYPFQQTTDRLRPEVKLVAICDAFDSLISGVGGVKMKVYEAIEYLRAYAGVLFDSAITAKVLASVAMYPVGMKVVTSDNETGVVFRQNAISDRPVLKMLTKSDGSEYEANVYKDLMKVLTVFIIDTID